MKGWTLTAFIAIEKCTMPRRLMSTSQEQVKESQCMLGEYAEDVESPTWY